MVTAEERMKILKMVREGKITAEEGAKLLAALSSGQKGTRKATTQPSGRARMFRVRVTDMASGKSKTTVNIPIRLMEMGLHIGAQFAPELSGLDLEQLNELLASGMEGKIVDVIDEEDGEHVEIFVE